MFPLGECKRVVLTGILARAFILFWHEACTYAYSVPSCFGSMLGVKFSHMLIQYVA